MAENKYSKLQGEPQTRSNDGWRDSKQQETEGKLASLQPQGETKFLTNA